MRIIDILNEYRSGELEFKIKYGLLDDETREKVNVLEQIFVDIDLVDYVVDSTKIVRMYYKEKRTIEYIAEAMYMSPRTVSRRRDECLKWLSDHFDRE